MFQVPMDGILAYGCSGCGAVFLSREHAERALAGAARGAPLVAEHGAEGKPTVDARTDTGPLQCPACAATMAPQWLRGNTIRIDHCAAHGTFFDAHELALLSPKPSMWTPRGPRNNTVGEFALELINSLLGGGRF
jgi:hypothetical protein